MVCRIGAALPETDRLQTDELGFETTEFEERNGIEMGDDESKIDVQQDSFQVEQTNLADEQWDNQIRAIKVRQPEPSAEEQIRSILDMIEAPRGEPTAEQAKEALKQIESMQERIPDYEKFVASSFQHFYPAWEELLRGTGRKSAKKVLSWIKNGYKPKFAGTKDAKPAKRRIVEAMLRRVVPAGKIPEMLEGKLPHRVAFANHQSLYDKWEFTMDQTAKLTEYGAAGIWEGEEEPEVINPMEVVDSAGKDRLICNGMYPNLFLEALPFKYEPLRDLLAFTKHGSFLATWDLKSGYFHVPIHPAYYKYFGFR